MQHLQAENLPSLPEPEDAMQYPERRLQADQVRLCQRPAFGTLGDKVLLLANYYKIDTSDRGFFFYTLGIRYADQGVFRVFPQRLACDLLIMLAIEEGWRDDMWKFDGGNLFFTQPEPLCGDDKREPVLKTVKLPGDRQEMEFQIEFSYQGRAKFNDLIRFVENQGGNFPTRVLQALQVVINSKFVMDPYCQKVGVSFFNAYQQECYDLGGDAELWLGYRQPVRICQKGAFLTLDTTATAFVKQICLHEYIFELLNIRGNEQQLQQRRLSRQEIDYVAEKMQGLWVYTEYSGGRLPKRKHKVRGVGIPPGEYLIQDLQKSITEYLCDQYGDAARVYYPLLPCVIVRNDNQIPPELCRIKGGQRRVRLNEVQKSEMTRRSIQNPNEKKRTLQRRIHEIKEDLDFEPGLGVSLHTEMMQVRGRVLEPPQLNYGSDQIINRSGQWQTRQEYKDPAQVRSWAVVSFVRAEDIDLNQYGLRYFLNVLMSEMRGRGMYAYLSPGDQAINPPVYYVNDTALDTVTYHLQQGLFEAQRVFNEEAKFLLVMLPIKSSALYGQIKQSGLRKLGIQTQCVLKGNVRIGDKSMEQKCRQYCENLVMKINTKLNGVNQQLANQQLFRYARLLPGIETGKPYMIVGVDISHPPPGDFDSPSVAAVVATYSKYCDRYVACISRQKNRTEVVLNLEEIMRFLLLNFYQQTPQLKPEMIIYYRNGIVEGKMYNTLIDEYNQIRQACYSMGDGSAQYCPPISFINLTKRHNTRIFPGPGHQLDTRSGNVGPGTVVDLDICHPFEFDYFLVSHIGTMGTAKPIHYQVLRDENGMGPNNLQELTYFLCYTCARCTRSVSIVLPVYYASISAEKGMILARGEAWDQEIQSQIMELHENIIQVNWFI